MSRDIIHTYLRLFLSAQLGRRRRDDGCRSPTVACCCRRSWGSACQSLPRRLPFPKALSKGRRNMLVLRTLPNTEPRQRRAQTKGLTVSCSVSALQRTLVCRICFGGSRSDVIQEGLSKLAVNSQFCEFSSISQNSQILRVFTLKPASKPASSLAFLGFC